MKARKILKFILLPIFICYSCIPQNKIEYVRDKIEEEESFKINNLEYQKIKPNDELYIKVSSFDDLSYNFFSEQSDYRYMSFGNELSLSLVSYTVNDSGYIYFPILELVYLKDLTLIEATNKMKELLNDYFNQPTIIIKFVNKKISVLGEVNHPGYITYTKDRISIFEALTMAGDITITGNKKEVILIRENDNNIIKKCLDLTSDDIFTSNEYFLKSNDILYVKPLRSAKWRTTSTPISITLTTIATIMIVINTLNLVQ